MAELSAEQKKLVQKTWAIVEKNKEAVGNAFFSVMFQTYPDYLAFFSSYDISAGAEALVANQTFAQEHIVGKVLKSIGKLISNIDDPSIESVLLQLGKSHKKRNITQTHFENVKKLLAGTVKNHLADNWTPEVAKAWQIFLDGAFSIIYKAY